MKKLIFVAFALFSLSPLMAQDYIGSWEYAVRDTPTGDYYGILVFEKQGSQLKGVMKSDNSNFEFPLNNLKIEGNKLSFDTYAEGVTSRIEGTFDGNMLLAKVVVAGDEYPYDMVAEN